MSDITIPRAASAGTGAVSRRRFLQASAAATVAAGASACSRDQEPIVRPEGVPLSAFDKKSTAEQVTAGIDLAGRTVLVTGATSGLGLETMRVLHARGARVLGTGRTLDKASAACASVGERCTPLALELEDLDSVRACSDAVRALGVPVDVLVCNAGIMNLPALEQVRGIEKHFFVNHLGHFLLVNRLLPQVQAAPQGRVVVVTSSAYKWAPPAGIELEDLGQSKGEYSAQEAYGIAKTANGLFSLELARRFQGTAATSNSVNPGAVDTNLWRHLPAWQRAFTPLLRLMIKSPAQGAATQCYVATAPALATVSGHYFSDCNPEVPGGQMRNAELAQRLWAKSEELCAGWLG